MKLSFLFFLMASSAWANVSLVIPDFDPQPLSAEIVGVGTNNMTTYLLVPGLATGTFSTQPPAFTGTATLVENANNVVFEYADSAVTVIESCSYASGVAGCEVVLGGAGGTTGTAEDTVTALLVQGGGTASSVVSSLSVLATSSVTATTTTSGVTSSVPGQTTTGAVPTQTNGGVRTSGVCTVAIVGLAVALFL